MGDMADYYIDQMFDGYDYGGYFLDEEPEFYFSDRPHGPGKCPKCKRVTFLRSGKFGKFYGCMNYPECKGSRSL